MRPHPCVILGFSRGIDDEIETAIFSQPRHHQIIQRAAGLGCELRVADLPGGKPQNIPRHQLFERPRNRFVGWAGEEGLAHMGDIKQPCRFARVGVFGQNARRILHGHLIARKRHHAGTQAHMQII